MVTLVLLRAFVPSFLDLERLKNIFDMMNDERWNTNPLASLFADWCLIHAAVSHLCAWRSNNVRHLASEQIPADSHSERHSEHAQRFKCEFDNVSQFENWSILDACLVLGWKFGTWGKFTSWMLGPELDQPKMLIRWNYVVVLFFNKEVGLELSCRMHAAQRSGDFLNPIKKSPEYVPAYVHVSSVGVWCK